MNVLRPVCLLAALSIFAGHTFADDWPQWNGKTGKGIVTESGLLETIPADGLPVAWKSPVSWGYSGPAIANGRVFVTDYQLKSGKIANNPGARDELTGTERVLCLDEKTGNELWKHTYARDYAVSYGGGPRVVPTVHDGRVYTIGAEGDLVCLNAESGDVVWQHDFAKEYGAVTPFWGHSAAPLVYKGSLICLVGGEGSLVVAFDLVTGKEKWKTLSSEGKDGTGYCPPTIINHAGVDQLLVWSPKTLSSLNPETREVYWQHKLEPGYGMSILPPMLDGNLLYTAGENSKSLMLELSTDKPAAKEVWRGTPRNSVYFATSSGLFENGHIYGADIRSGAMVCVQASDGKRLWQTTQLTMGKENVRRAGHASAFMLKTTGDNYVLFTETGDVVSATMNPAGYKETGRFNAIEPTENISRRKLVWTYPAIANGRLYLRNDKEVIAYDLTAK